MQLHLYLPSLEYTYTQSPKDRDLSLYPCKALYIQHSVLEAIAFLTSALFISETCNISDYDNDIQFYSLSKCSILFPTLVDSPLSF